MSKASAPRVWTIPLVIATAMLASLVGALVEEGAWDYLASLTLAIILVTVAVLGFRSREARERDT